MIVPVIGQDDALSAWVAANLSPNDRGFGKCTAIGWASKDGMLAATVFHNWEPDAGIIEMSTYAASPRWLTRETLRLMFAYVFDVCECQMVVMRVSERNERMCSIARRFGFSEITIPRLRGRDEAEIIFTLTDDQWKSAQLVFGLASA